MKGWKIWGPVCGASPEWNCPSKSIQRVTCAANAVAHSTAARVIMGFAGFSESTQTIARDKELCYDIFRNKGRDMEAWKTYRAVNNKSMFGYMT